MNWRQTSYNKRDLIMADGRLVGHIYWVFTADDWTASLTMVSPWKVLGTYDSEDRAKKTVENAVQSALECC